MKLKGDIQGHFHPLDKSERILTPSATITENISKNLYEDLSIWLLMTCDQIQADKNTKFVARHYLDFGLCHIVLKTQSYYVLLASICIGLAKYKKSDQWVVNQTFVSFISEISSSDYNRDQIISLSNQICPLVAHSGNITTPYDLIRASANKFPYFNSQIQKLELFADLAITFVPLSQFTAGSIFFACLRAFIQLNRIHSQDFLNKELIGSTYEERAEVICDFIMEKMNEF